MGKRILVADDDPAIVEVIQLILEDDYDVETMIGGDVAKVVVETRPHLVLLDIWMSGYDGRELCRKLKSQEETQGIPIIMISANRETERFARECGADDFLAKPFEMQVLLDKVEKGVRSRMS